MTETPINLNETTLCEDLIPDETYDVRVTLATIYDNSDDDYPRINLYYEQHDGQNRSITLWENSSPDDVYGFDFTAGVTYVLTDIEYSQSNQYHNLTATGSTTVENARSYEGEVDEDTETFAGGEPVDVHIDDGLPDAETPDGSSSPPPSSAVVDEGADSEDAVVTDKSIADTFENESGHVMTSFVSEEPLSPITCHRYDLTLTGADSPDMESGRKSLVYEARRRLYAVSDVAVIATDQRNLQLLTLSPVADDALTLDELHLTVADDHTLDYETPTDRAIAKELVEEAYKTTLREDWDVRGIDTILNPAPVVETENFALHERYDCSVEIGHGGLVYLHISFRHRRLSSLSLDSLPDDDIFPGLRVKTTYGQHSGYIVRNIGNETVTDDLKRLQNRSVVQYHRENKTVPEPELDAIELADVNIIEAYKQGHGGGDDPAALPPELLVVQGTTKQVRRFDETFADAIQGKERLSATRCASKAREFIAANDQFTLKELEMSFDTTLFSGNNEQHLVQLYEQHDHVLTFTDGETGSHPDETFTKGIIHPPESFNVTLVRPERRRDDSDNGWAALSQVLMNAGAEPTLLTTIEYDPFDSPPKIGLDIGSEIDAEQTDAVLVVLPPDVDFDGLAPPGDVYDEGKETLANGGVYSQMADIDNFDGSQTFLTRNIALGLLAAAGGVPFTVEDSLPGNADMFVGIDISRRYPDESSDGQINISATTTAIYKDGTILGHSSASPQLGEKLSGKDTRRIMRDAVLGYKKRHGSDPEHIVIHRDGFMDEDLTLALAFLDDLNISYDIVEIRKQPQTRILREGDVQFEVPTKSVAVCNQNSPKATLVTFGAPETLATSDYSGLPRPIQIERIAGNTDIEILVRQVYLLSQSHVGVHNSTARLPITTLFADKASSAATKGHLVQTGTFEPNLGFI